jgi:hypothetical protein
VHMKVFWMKSRKANVVWQSHSGLIFIWVWFRACRFFELLSTLLAMVWSGEHRALALWMMGQTHIQIQICLGHFHIYLIQLPWRWREEVCSPQNLGHTIITWCNNCQMTIIWPQWSCKYAKHTCGATKLLCHLMHVWKCTDHMPDKMYFQHTVNSVCQRYIQSLLQLSNSSRETKGTSVCQAHHANKSMDFTGEEYGNRIINEGLWAPRAPEL